MLLLNAKGSAVGFCAQTANLWLVIGYVVNVIKIAIPLILIVLGMIDLGKAVISNEDKAINKSVTSLVKRFVAAIVMFFVPTIVSMLFSILSLSNITSGDANICFQCVTNIDKKDLTVEYTPNNSVIKGETSKHDGLNCKEVAKWYSNGIK